MPSTIEMQFFNTTEVTLNRYQSTISGTGRWTTEPPATLDRTKPQHAVCVCDPGANINVVYKPDSVRLLAVEVVLTDSDVRVATSASPGYKMIAHKHKNDSGYIIALEYRTVPVEAKTDPDASRPAAGVPDVKDADADADADVGESEAEMQGTCYAASDCQGNVLGQNVTKQDCFNYLGGASWRKNGAPRCWEN